MVHKGYTEIRVEQINFTASLICTDLMRAGYEASMVGGCVRDLIMNRIPKDWDICTNATPEQVIFLFSTDEWEVVLTGIKHGTVTIVNKGTKEGFEVTTYRIDGSYTDGRHPDNVTFTSSLDKDLSRRDFTMNAIALQVNWCGSPHIYDPFGGLSDIENKLVRCVGNAHERFSEDALRMLRAVRFACQLGFCIDDATYEALKENTSKISAVSMERVRDELVKILSSDAPQAGFRMLYDRDLLRYVTPELHAMKSCTQSKPWHIYDVFEHTMHVLETIARTTHHSQLSVRLAALYHDIGKLETKTVDEDGTCHFYGHPAVSARIAEESLRRLRFDNDTIADAISLISYHDVTFEPSKRVVRRIMQKLRSPELFHNLVSLRISDVKAQNPDLVDDRLDRAIKCNMLSFEIMKENSAMRITDLVIDGHDVMKFGFKGPEIGEVLQDLLDLVTDEVVENEREKLLALLNYKLPKSERGGFDNE